MPHRLAGIVLLTGTVLWGAPLPSVPSERPAQDAVLEEARQRGFAEGLLVVVDHVVRYYVRPVEENVLLRAAVKGLYERARRPVPEDLLDRLQQADGEGRSALLLRAYAETAATPALQGQNVLLVACQEMMASLDPHSQLVVPGERGPAERMDTEGAGVGLELEEYAGVGPLKVTTVEPGSPAQKAGVRPGDAITQLEGKPVERLEREQVRQILEQGPEPENPFLPEAPATPPLRIAVERGAARLSFAIEKGRFEIETVLGVHRRDDHSWEYLADRAGKLAFVRVTRLARGTAEQLAAVMQRLDRQGVRGVVLDLRWCPGGYLNEAVDCARLFLREGTIATVRPREGDPNVFGTATDGPYLEVPLAVLINEHTSGGAELIACALRDHGRAVVVGERSRGKASVQTPIHLAHPSAPPGLGLKLTTGIFIRPSGKNLNRFADSKWADDWGVRPDPGHEIPVSPAMSERLKTWWERQSLRPGPSMERLPLDDPAADPQRVAALEALEKLVKGK